MTHLPLSLEANKVAATQVRDAHHSVATDWEFVKLASRQVPGGAVALTHRGPTQMANGHYPGDGLLQALADRQPGGPR